MRNSRCISKTPVDYAHEARRIDALLVHALGIAVLLCACAKQPGTVATEQPPPVTGRQAADVAPGGAGGPSSSLSGASEAVTPPPAPPREQPSAQVTQAASKESPLQDIFFDFDKAVIRPDAKPALAEDIAWLKAHPTAVITIAGHCDERGTIEYNLALGARRATAGKNYLVAAGIDGRRLKTVSYGKERPFVFGHDEAAWKWNRRDHFVEANR